MRLAHHILGWGLCLLLTASCAPRAQRPAPIEPAAPVGEASEVGPRVSEEPAGGAGGEGVEASEARAAEQAGGDDAGVWRADGRPLWWFEGVLTSEGRMSVAAEAIARDVVSARRLALESARESLRRAAGEVVGERVEAVLVRRLSGDGPGRDRYVGYVRLSCARDG